jgi:hypothetical protein
MTESGITELEIIETEINETAKEIEGLRENAQKCEEHEVLGYCIDVEAKRPRLNALINARAELKRRAREAKAND